MELLSECPAKNHNEANKTIKPSHSNIQFQLINYTYNQCDTLVQLTLNWYLNDIVNVGLI